MCHQKLAISWFSLVLLASPLVAIWELEKDGKQSLLCSMEAPGSKPGLLWMKNEVDHHGLGLLHERYYSGEMHSHSSFFHFQDIYLVWFSCWKTRKEAFCRLWWEKEDCLCQ